MGFKVSRQIQDATATLERHREHFGVKGVGFAQFGSTGSLYNRIRAALKHSVCRLSYRSPYWLHNRQLPASILQFNAELIMGNNFAIERVVRDDLVTHQVIVSVNNFTHLSVVRFFRWITKIEPPNHLKLSVLELVSYQHAFSNGIGFNVVAKIVVGVLRNGWHD